MNNGNCDFPGLGQLGSGSLSDYVVTPSAIYDELDKDLRDRDSRYGKFKDNSEVSQSLKSVLRAGERWQTLPYWQKEALELIAMKMGRLVSGNCSEQKDSWYDIAGYAKLGSGDFD